MKKYSLLIMCIAMLILASSAMAQLKNRVPDDGTAVALGSMVKLNALGEISVCGDDDDDVAGIVTAIVPDGATNYYLITASDIYPARLSATVTAGDRLTTSAGGALRTAASGEVTVGWALEDGHATELRKAIISLDYVAIVDWDTLAAYSDTTITNLILDSLAIYLLENDTILYSDTAGFAWKIPCDSVNECIDWDTLGAYADTSVVWDTLAAYSDTTITNLILDSLAIYLLENDTILYSDTAGFAWKIPCDSVNECIDWDTLGAYPDTNITNAISDSLGAYLDTTYTGDNLGDHTATENLQMSGFWVSNDGDNEGLFVDTDGNVGIGTSTPTAKLQVQNGSVLFDGTTGTTPVSGAGTRMMWVPSKYAFRAGRVTGVQWDPDSIGDYSFATGYNTKATGLYSTAMGVHTNASGESSTAMGSFTTASGLYSTAMGFMTTASSDNSIAMGNNTLASGNGSTAMGVLTTAAGQYSTVMGEVATAYGYASTAMGARTTAQPFASVAMGRYNVISGDSLNWVATDPLFIVGNGTNDANRSNALTVLKDGSLILGKADNNTTTDSILVLGNDGTVGWASKGELDDGDWADSTTFLMVIGQKGIFGNGNVGYGDHDSTHVNLGVAGTTGTSGSDLKYATVSGGFNNRATGRASTVGGGEDNIASALNSVIAGGDSSRATAWYSFIGGGFNNETSQQGAAIVGGWSNEASGQLSFIGGGEDNIASALKSVIAGGDSSRATAWYSFIGAGWNNTAGGVGSAIAGGFRNTVSDSLSFIGAGWDNTISGKYSAIPGGLADTVSGDYSFAFGRNVNVSTDYTAQFNSPSYKGILRNYGNLEFSDTLVGGIGTADTFRIFDDGDTTRFESDNPIKIGDGSLIVETDGDVFATQALFIGDVPDDAAPESVLTIDGGQVKKYAIADLPSGVPGGVSEYAYIYNLSTQAVAVGAGIPFDNNGIIKGSITHTAGTAPITLGSSGDYAIWFNVAAVEANQFALFLNGVSVASAIYGSGAGTQPNPGLAIITANAGDVLTLRNHSSAAAVTLQSLAGGSEANANASILIQKLPATGADGVGFQQLRANGSPWLTDSVTLVSGDVSLTQDGDSITFDVDWDTLGAYPDTNITNAILDSLGAYVDTTQISGLSTFKIHRTDSLKNPTTSAWTGFPMTEIVAEESFGSDFTWPYSGDSTTIQVNSEGLYEFGGCIHFKNIGGSSLPNLKILSRIIQITNSEADTSEARCSQRDWMGNLAAEHVRHMTYSGTAYLEENDLLQIQYWTNTSAIVFINDNEFDTEVAVTLWLNKLK